MSHQPAAFPVAGKLHGRKPITLGVGVDIITISRMRDVLDTSGGPFIKKVFTPWEQERLESHPDRVAYAAMTFAAKEAVFKTFGISWSFGVQMNEVEVRDGQYGEPLVILTGRFAEVAAERGVKTVHLSLSYDGDYAIAMAALA
jgi:holo-[acyl-carrier protein] synthase